MTDKKMPLCIKLNKNIRERFKQVTHERNTTMQNVLNGFVSYYIENPHRFLIENNTSIVINTEVLNDESI